MSESITKFNHRAVVEQSVYNFIDYLETQEKESIPEDHKEWLFEKGNEIFDAYYIDDFVQVNLTSKEDKDALEKYFGQVQESLGRMFAHIMLVEYKLFVLGVDK